MRCRHLLYSIDATCMAVTVYICPLFSVEPFFSFADAEVIVETPCGQEKEESKKKKEREERKEAREKKMEGKAIGIGERMLRDRDI